MKHLFIFLLCLLAVPAWAQKQPGQRPQPPVQPAYSCTEEVSRQQHDADSLLQELDKSQIPTHLLYDRVYQRAGLDHFNQLFGNPDTSSFRHYLQAYYELHAADYDNPHTAPCRQVLADNARHYQVNDTILLGVLRYRFNYIDSNAVRNNLLRWDTQAPSKLFDVPGRSASPYALSEVALAAALADSTSSGTVRFRLDLASIFTNTNLALLSASINFGDGSGSHVLTPGQLVQISYSTPGLKTLCFVLSYAGGGQFTTYANLYVPRAAGVAYRTGSSLGPSPPPNNADGSPCYTEKLTAAIPYLGIAGQAEVSYYYSANKTCSGNSLQNITKPVIIIDGIDYEGSREGIHIYNGALLYKEQGQRKNLGDELRDAGYDVVILDFPNVERSLFIGGVFYHTVIRHGGADFMARNALTLVTLIQQLNQQLQLNNSTEKIVVIGPSMGGQVARYALAYMEYSNLPHNTRLFVSLDSPHNGANIPIGLQHFVDYFVGKTGDQKLREGLDELNSMASRELAQVHYTQGTPFQAHGLRTQFLNELAVYGNYPSQLRRVAVTNGSIDGFWQRDQNGQVIQSGEQAFGLEQRGVPPGGAGLLVYAAWPNSLLARVITIASARVYFQPGYGRTTNVLQSYYFPNGHSQQATGPAGSCGLDGSPGGSRFFFTFTENRGIKDVFQAQHFYGKRDQISFIPTASGLGYNQPVDNCQALGPYLVCNGKTPFDAYYGPTGRNEAHIQLTAENVDFIRREILLQTPKPTLGLAPKAICPGATATYSVDAECTQPARTNYTPPATTYNWTSGSGLVVVSGQGTPAVQIQAANGFAGTSTVQVVATRAGYAASEPVTVNVTVTRGELTLTPVPMRQAGPSQPAADKAASRGTGQGPTTDTTCPGVQVPLRISSLNVPPPYTVTRTNYNANQQPTGQSSYIINGNDFSVTVNRTYFSVQVTSISPCDGQPVTSNAPYFVPQPCDGKQLAAYPNPADATLHLVAEEGEAPEAGPLAATLYNAQGLAVRRSATTELATADLPAGL